MGLFWTLKIFITDGDGSPESSFFFFFLDTQIKYSLGIGVYVHIYTFVQNNYLMGFIFWTGWGVPPTLRNNIFLNRIL